MILLTGKNNLSFVWLSNGNLVIRGLPPGQYVVQNSVTNITIQQIGVSSQNSTETTQTSVSPVTITTTTATQTVQPSVQTATTATGASGIQPPPLAVVPTPQSTANGQTRQIGALQIATWALVGVAAFLLAYLLSGFVLSRKP